MLALILFGLCGTTAELILLGHYEMNAMLVPFVALAFAMVSVIARLARPSARSVRRVRGAMGALLVSGLLGVYFHYRGGLEFQEELAPTVSAWTLFWKVVRMKAPPMLAPGVLVQLALLGLAATYRDPLVATPMSVNSER